MNQEPVKIKPHHAEGAQRFIAWGKNEAHEIMFNMLKDELEKDPDAELVFVRGYDKLCVHSCIEDGKAPPCEASYGSSSVVTNMDEEIAKEHGWEFDTPYKIQYILDELREEASSRTIFYICQLTQDEHQQWLTDVRASKKNE